MIIDSFRFVGNTIFCLLAFIVKGTGRACALWALGKHKKAEKDTINPN